jgi:hypothetical protein
MKYSINWTLDSPRLSGGGVRASESRLCGRAWID